jgi:hypothetical protein
VCSEFHIERDFSGTFPIQNDLGGKKSALSPTLSIFALDYAFKRVQENQWVSKLNETGHVPFYTNHVDLLGENVNFIKNICKEFILSTKNVVTCNNAKKCPSYSRIAQSV